MLDKFPAWLKGRNCSESTIDAYLADAGMFVAWLGERGIVHPSAGQLQRWLDDIADEYGPATIARKYQAVRAYLLCCGIRATAEVKRPKKTRVSCLSAREVDLLLNASETGTLRGIRDHAMIRTLYATGCTVSELVSLGVSALREEYSTITVKQRVIAIDGDTQDALRRYMEVRSLWSQYPTGALFITARGDGMTRQSCWKILQDYAETAGISRTLSAKVIRHTFAVHALLRGVSRETVRKALGLSEKSTALIKRYAQEAE